MNFDSGFKEVIALNHSELALVLLPVISRFGEMGLKIAV